MQIGNISVGGSSPVYIIAEAGINHNGDIGDAIRLIDAAAYAGCQAVKFQKRDPDLSTPESQKSLPRETPWGTMTYLEYKKRIEFGREEYAQIDKHAKLAGIEWFASPWDVPSVGFLADFKVPAMKIASASITNRELVQAVAEVGVPAVMSTGMSTPEEIDTAVGLLSPHTEIALMHCTSTYPLAAIEANLRTLDWLRSRYGQIVGYSGHELGLQISLAAVALGAKIIERHITLDRSSWGSDQAASLEPDGFRKLVRDIRIVEESLGDGVKRVYESEQQARKKLRG